MNKVKVNIPPHENDNFIIISMFVEPFNLKVKVDIPSKDWIRNLQIYSFKLFHP